MLAQARRTSLRLSGAADGASVSTVMTRQRNSSADADAADMFPHGAYSRASAIELPSTHSRHRVGDGVVVSAASDSDEELLCSRPGSAYSVRAMPLASASMIQQWLDGKLLSTARLKSGRSGALSRTSSRPSAPPLSMGARRGSWLTAASDADPGPVASDDAQTHAAPHFGSAAGTGGRSLAAAAPASGGMLQGAEAGDAGLQDAATLALAADLVRSAAEDGTLPSAADAREIAAEAGIVLRTIQSHAAGTEGSCGGGIRRASSDADVVAELFTHVAAAALAQLSGEGAPQPQYLTLDDGYTERDGSGNQAMAPVAAEQRVAGNTRPGDCSRDGYSGDSFAALPVLLPSQAESPRDGSDHCAAVQTVSLPRRSSLLRSRNPQDSSPRASATASGVSSLPLAACADVSPRGPPRDSGTHSPCAASALPSRGAAPSGAPSLQSPPGRLAGAASGAAMLGTAAHAAVVSASPRAATGNRHAEPPAWTPAESPRASATRGRGSSPAASLRSAAPPSPATPVLQGQLPRSRTMGHFAAVRGAAGGASPAPRLSAAQTAAVALRPLRATPTAEVWRGDAGSAYPMSEDVTSASPTPTVSAVERGRIRGGVGRRLHSVVIDMGQMDRIPTEPADAVGEGSVFTSAASRALATTSRPTAASAALLPSAEISAGSVATRRELSGAALAHKSSALWARQASISATAAPVAAPGRAPVAALAPGRQFPAPGTQCAVDPPAGATGSSLTATRAVSSTVTRHRGAVSGASDRGWVLRSVDAATGPALSSPSLGLSAAEPPAALIGSRCDSVPRQRLPRRGSALAVAAAAAMIVRAGAGGPGGCVTTRGTSVSPAPNGGGGATTLSRRKTIALNDIGAAGRR
jgi:hypothetical protein